MENEVIEFFNSVNKAECYLHHLKKTNISAYNKLKLEASPLETEEVDEDIFDCMFAEEPKLVRYVLNTVNTSHVDSSYDNALRKTKDLRLRFWRDLFRGDISVEPEKQLLYLNYFTLFAGRTGGASNIQMLENKEYLEDRFIKEKFLAKLLNFHSQTITNTYKMNVNRHGDTKRVLLENSNAYLEKQISTLLGGQ
jgi:hypothetical protein